MSSPPDAPKKGGHSQESDKQKHSDAYFASYMNQLVETMDPLERRLREARSEGRDLMAELGLKEAGYLNRNPFPAQPDGNIVMPRMGLFKTFVDKKDNNTALPRMGHFKTAVDKKNDNTAMPRMGLFKTAVDKKNSIAAPESQTKDPVEGLSELGVERAGHGNSNSNTDRPTGNYAMPRMGLFRTFVARRNKIAASKGRKNSSALSVARKQETTRWTSKLEQDMKEELILMATKILVEEWILDKDDAYWDKLVGEDDGGLDYILGKTPFPFEQEDGEGEDEERQV
ncbi:hypothetical protein CDD80_4845 [Ophiocordyceps camponoti-rufipedis]|uniref:Uncharacterized protein n=1 Tax=Ophiocordyceps camponoti-rufipedis TaxID=2004952 RepID=A0A2C5XGX2_9HYPO|nr:hypothetical protein CDD80_4845 [Ophiocordyceps camponoti-rufipedis]